MDMHVSHVRRKQLPPYVFPEGYKRSRRHAIHLAEKICDEAEGDSTGPTDRPLKRQADSEIGDLTPSRVVKRASISPQLLETLSLEVNSKFYTPSPLSSGEVVKLNHTPDMLSHSQETPSFGQLEDYQIMKSHHMLVDKTNHKSDIADSISVVGNEASAMMSLPGDVLPRRLLLHLISVIELRMLVWLGRMKRFLPFKVPRLIFSGEQKTL